MGSYSFIGVSAKAYSNYHVFTLQRGKHMNEKQKKKTKQKDEMGSFMRIHRSLLDRVAKYGKFNQSYNDVLEMIIQLLRRGSSNKKRLKK